jgi:hypothetical protein
MDETKLTNNTINNTFQMKNVDNLGGRGGLGKIDTVHSLYGKFKKRFLPKILKFLSRSIKSRTSQKRQNWLGKTLLTGALLVGSACWTGTAQSADYTEKAGNITIEFTNGPNETWTQDRRDAVMRAFEYWNERIPGLTKTFKLSFNEPTDFSSSSTLASTDAVNATFKFNENYVGDYSRV